MDRFEEGLEKLQEIKGEVKDKIKSVKGGDHSFFVALWDNWIKFGRSLDRLPLVEISNWCFEVALWLVGALGLDIWLAESAI